MSADGCGAPAQTATPADIDTQGQVVVAGKVSGSDGPLGGAYVRLLNDDGDFAGEVQASSEGDFRFYAAPGAWTVRALHRTGNGEASVTAEGPGLHQVAISVA
ncbi:DUF1416 domain-containing protein [Amycolatopsis acidiphila]|uniref:DUF1416 domain-containing protein n=1 Tax=Amycolatopsis acidiphila TaxID=715473 RepID=A0A558A2I5_9PSEU|nr:DUF1416 domain-containing protein [Amycolatopsis acidiphila]TVT18465.1 DUF1416 domain-containing protein [Amycolatopsis acidiphila]UIJ60022.1 DUF1416 domain-containing protein [Amycolatopsis acidiphila]GHG61813.1 hypothetical protein GCM10017788_16910 [Amycolatopsis acidiphila]